MSGCATLQVAAATDKSSHSAKVAGKLAGIVERYFDALNRRDLLALTAYVTPDVEWYSMVGGERILEVAGREQLAALLHGYFEANERTHWGFENVQSVANIVAIKERSEWSDARTTQSRESIAVYEFVDGRVRRITNYLDSKQ